MPESSNGLTLQGQFREKRYDAGLSAKVRTPKVSIVLPTYNRAEFLPQAFASIRAQSFADWELIVIDDGSTDETESLVAEFASSSLQPVFYISQENKGPAAARNAGIQHARGECIAFFDSDDEWLPGHMSESVAALEANADVDWVYAATTVVNVAGETLQANCFYEAGRPRALFDAATEIRGELRVLDNRLAILVAIRDALYAGLQTSVVRRKVFSDLCLPPFRVGEDQAFAIAALKRGFKLSFLAMVHVRYRAHSGGVSNAVGGDRSKDIEVAREFIRAFEWLEKNAGLSGLERRALNRRLAHECFWNLGYNYQRSAKFAEARSVYRVAIARDPFRLQFWKTYLLSYVKSACVAILECRSVLSVRCLL